VALEENIPVSKIKKGIKDFRGVSRRFEIDEIELNSNLITLIDDYGHHPAEILATISAIKEKFPRTGVCMIFEPHRFSRTKQLFNDFIKVFSKIDYLVLLDIYPASEKPIKGINSKKLCLEINKNNGNAIYVPNNNAVLKWLIKNSSNFKVLVTQGAGTISKLNHQIKNKWKLKK
jgi:UDP-N-acetylmuramate--alanine ligase